MPKPAHNARVGRPPRPARTVVNILSKQDGETRHLYAWTLQCSPSELHQLISEWIHNRGVVRLKDRDDCPQSAGGR